MGIGAPRAGRGHLGSPALRLQVGIGGILCWPQPRRGSRGLCCQRGDSLGGEVLITAPCFLALFLAGPSAAEGRREAAFPSPIRQAERSAVITSPSGSTAATWGVESSSPDSLGGHEQTCPLAPLTKGAFFGRPTPARWPYPPPLRSPPAPPGPRQPTHTCLALSVSLSEPLLCSPPGSSHRSGSQSLGSSLGFSI